GGSTATPPGCSASGRRQGPRALLVAEDDGQARLVAQDDQLGVGALRELVGDLDGLPLEEFGADALGDDPLKIADAPGLPWMAGGSSGGSWTLRSRTCSASIPRGARAAWMCLNMFWETTSREDE